MKTKHKIIGSILSGIFMLSFGAFHQVDTHHASTQEVLAQLNTHNSTNLTKSAYFDWLFLLIFLIFLVFNIYLWTRKDKTKHSNVTVNKDEFDFFKEKEMNHEEEH